MTGPPAPRSTACTSRVNGQHDHQDHRGQDSPAPRASNCSSRRSPGRSSTPSDSRRRRRYRIAAMLPGTIPARAPGESCSAIAPCVARPANRPHAAQVATIDRPIATVPTSLPYISSFGADAGEHRLEQLVAALLDRALQHPAARQHQRHQQDIGAGERQDRADHHPLAPAALGRGRHADRRRKRRRRHRRSGRPRHWRADSGSEARWSARPAACVTNDARGAPFAQSRTAGDAPKSCGISTT